MARRALINVRVGTVAANGAVVASIARQPPYGLDWPRDGAFFNVLLDASGQSAEVSRRVALYAEWQRAGAVPPTVLVDPTPPPDPDTGQTLTYPAAAWEMNYYADGLAGGTWRFEIDNTAFALWTSVAHLGWLPEAERVDYLANAWPGIAAAADLLARWRDPETGLHAPAQEDDNAAYTQTLHGAITTWGALDIAARAAVLLDRQADAARWSDRATELGAAIIDQFYRSDVQAFVSDVVNPVNPGSAETGPTSWLVWPMALLPWNDVRVDAQLARDLDSISRSVDLQTPTGGYMLKTTLSAAIQAGMTGDSARSERVLSLLEKMASHATGTDHFGEIHVPVVDGGGELAAEQRVANPHLWEGTLFCLTAMALENAPGLLSYADALPASTSQPEAVPPTVTAGGGGCSCHQAGQKAAPWAAALVLWALRRRSARRRA